MTFGNSYSFDISDPLLIDVVRHDLYEEIVAKDTPKLSDPRLSLTMIFTYNVLRKSSANAPSKTNKSITVPLKKVIVTTWILIEA